MSITRLVATRFVFVLVLCAASQCSAAQAQSTNNGSVEPPPSREEVARAIDLATGYLERSCGPDGKFIYKVDVRTGKASSSYNVIRHAGAIYALAMANRYHRDPKLESAIIRSARYLHRNYVGTTKHQGELAIWSKPIDEVRAGSQNYAELGATGLGLVALTAAWQLDHKVISHEELRALGMFARSLQRDNGSFIHKFLENGELDAGWQSLYYPGEAALGFVELYKIDKSHDWLIAAAKALAYLARSRSGMATVPADHWALIATAALLPYVDQVNSVVSPEELMRHAEQICGSIIREQVVGPETYSGSFDHRGRTAPTATRLEGLLAALEFVRERELQSSVEVALERGTRYLINVQIPSGPFAGGMPVAQAIGARTIRIDFVQHALCVWLRYQATHEAVR